MCSASQSGPGYSQSANACPAVGLLAVGAVAVAGGAAAAQKQHQPGATECYVRKPGSPTLVKCAPGAKDCTC